MNAVMYASGSIAEACECTAALSLLPEDIQEMKTNTATSRSEQVQPLDPEKRLRLYAELCVYRESLRKQATDSAGQATTGLTDNLIIAIPAFCVSITFFKCNVNTSS